MLMVVFLGHGEDGSMEHSFARPCLDPGVSDHDVGTMHQRFANRCCGG